MKYCQGPDCHRYETKDRLRGPKGAKYYQTRRRSEFYYMGGNVCSLRCQDDWFKKFGEQAINHFGRIHEPIKLTADNAWHKLRDWGADTDTWYSYNSLTKEQRPITEEQYEDDRFTLNTR
jgi:hypothetical protein|tara:strand:+ start:308 stop:667 length:360 start_codon:yes stop_codon:yes gene_type:complete